LILSPPEVPLSLQLSYILELKISLIQLIFRIS